MSDTIIKNQVKATSRTLCVSQSCTEARNLLITWSFLLSCYLEQSCMSSKEAVLKKKDKHILQLITSLFCSSRLESHLQTHLQHHTSHHNQDGQQRHPSHPAQVHGLQDEEACPAQLLVRVRRVPHAVHPFHFQLFDETTAQVAQLVKAELSMVATHTTVSCA